MSGHNHVHLSIDDQFQHSVEVVDRIPIPMVSALDRINVFSFGSRCVGILTYGFNIIIIIIVIVVG